MIKEHKKHQISEQKELQSRISLQRKKVEKQNIIILICLILVITFIVFLPSVENDFVNLDDNILVTQNAKIKSLSWENIESFFTSFHYGLYHPLVLLSYAVEYHLFGLNARVYHIVNLILHLFNCFLVFWLILKLTNNMLISSIVAILFGIHPLHVESVAWISGRKDVFYAFFFLLSLIYYLHHLRDKNVKYYYLSLLTFVLSLFSKPTAIMLPFVLFLFDYIAGRKFTKDTVKEKMPFLVVSIFFGIITVLANKAAGNIQQSYSFTFFYNILNAGTGLIFYLIKTVIPTKLSVVYPSLDRIGGIFSSVFPFSFVIVIVLSAVIFFSVRYTRKIVFGSLFFLAILLPVLHLIPVGWAIPADRYTYIPLIGLFYVVGEAFSFLWHRKIVYTKAIKVALLIVLIMTVGIFSFMTRQRCQVWKNSITLNEDVLNNYSNVSLAYKSLGNVYSEKGKYDKAIYNFGEAIKINPDEADLYFNRGNAYKNKGEYDKAICDYDKAIEIDSNCTGIFINRGATYAEKGEYDKAISDYTQALKINPNYAQAYYNRGIIYNKRNEHEKAKLDFTQAAKLDPNLQFKGERKIVSSSAKAHYDLGDRYGKKGEYDKAIDALNHAIEIDPNYSDAYHARAVAYFMKKEYDKAWRDIHKLQNMNYKINPKLLELLRKSSGRQ